MEKQTETPATVTPAETTGAAAHEPRNFFVAFLLTTLAGPLGLRHFYLGDKKLGWIRTGLFAGGYVWIFLMALLQQGSLATLGFLAVSVAAIWAIVDFFYVYNAVKTDAEGQPVTATARDRRWAKGIYLATIIACVAVFVLSILGASLAENVLRDNFRNNNDFESTNLEEDGFNTEDFLKQMEAESESQSF